MKPDKLVRTAVHALEDIKAQNIDVLDTSQMNTLFDFMIIASAESTRQTKALANNVQVKVKADGGTVYSMEGDETGEWILVDLGNILVHIMQTAARLHYNLEDLWREARKIRKPASKSAKNTAASPKVRKTASAARMETDSKKADTKPVAKKTPVAKVTSTAAKTKAAKTTKSGVEKPKTVRSRKPKATDSA